MAGCADGRRTHERTHVRRPLALAAATAAALALTLAAPASALAEGSATTTVETLSPAGSPTAAAQGLLASLPADWPARVAAAETAYGVTTTPWAALTSQQCGPTAMTDYANAQVASIGSGLMGFLSQLGVFAFPSMDAMLFGAESSSDLFGGSATTTRQLTQEMRDLRRFWDTPTQGVQLVPMHGSDVYSDPARLARVLVAMGMPQDQAAVFAPQLIGVVRGIPALEGGENPLFTLNAFSFTPPAGMPGVTPKIVVGDGLLEAFDAVGLGDLAPRAVLAHEFSHQVQEADGLTPAVVTPDTSRVLELRADAFGTYFLTHARGAALNAKRLLPAEQTYFELGDCNELSPQHHGTPDQRLRAAAWGAATAASAQKQGQVLPSLELEDRFQAALPGILAG